MRIKYKMFIEKLWYERDIKRFNEIWIVNTYLDKFYKVDCRNSAGVK